MNTKLEGEWAVTPTRTKRGDKHAYVCVFRHIHTNDGPADSEVPEGTLSVLKTSSLLSAAFHTHLNPDDLREAAPPLH